MKKLNKYLRGGSSASIIAALGFLVLPLFDKSVSGKETFLKVMIALFFAFLFYMVAKTVENKNS